MVPKMDDGSIRELYRSNISRIELEIQALEIKIELSKMDIASKKEAIDHYTGLIMEIDQSSKK